MADAGDLKSFSFGSPGSTPGGATLTVSLLGLIVALGTGCSGTRTPATAPSEAPPSKTVARTPAPSATKGSPPRLVLWLTVDQLPVAVFERIASTREGFFRRARTGGRYYSEARFRHANTETAPGHATLFTGRSPRSHGIIANEWWNEAAGSVVPSTFDPSSPLLPANAEAPGRSPAALRGDTITDALRARYGSQSESFALSLKDRGAILPAGRSGKAFWVAGGRFTTSRYYYETLPEWFDAEALDARLAALTAEDWVLSETPESYAAKPAALSPRAARYWGPRFPHRPAADATRDELLRASPAGDRAVLELARIVVEGTDLGGDETPDLLALSLSANDYVGHYFGPETLEAEDLLRRLDDELERFVAELEARVGRDGLLVVLSSDHGGSVSPEASRASEGRGEFWIASDVERETRAVLAKLRRGARTTTFPELRAVVPPYVFLERGPNGARLGPKGCRALGTALRERLRGLKEAFCVGELLEKTERSSLEEAVFQSLHPDVSGDLYLVFEERTQFLQEARMVATHGSPWDYDRRVPVALVGASLEPLTVPRPVFVEALAPTVAALLGVDLPGEVLGE